MYVIIGRKGCEWCEKAVDLLEARYKPYEYFSLDHCKWLKLLMVKSGYTTVPLIFYDNTVLGGYAELEEVFYKQESKL